MMQFNHRKKNPNNVTPLRPENRWWRNAKRGPFKKFRHKGIYLLPNLLTTAAFFCGFVAVVKGIHHQFEIAALAIFFAMVLDGMDGRIARLTNTQTAFGAQYDSLSDMLAFGVAPAIMVYEWQLKSLGKVGWLAAFIYCASVALRLARFNANLDVVDKRFFQGLPSPAAASLLAGFVWLMIDDKNIFKVLTLSQPALLTWISFALTLYAACAMVSNLPFYSGKAHDVHYRIPFRVLVFSLIMLVLISSHPPLVLFVLFILYALSGLGVYAYRKLK